MKDTVHIGRIVGVAVGLHWSLLLIGGILAQQLAYRRFPNHAPGYSKVEYLVTAIATAFAFLVCVLAHEVSHAVVARRQRIGVDGITLGFLGGATRMATEPPTPMAEVAVAAVGPLTSFVVGAAFVGVAIAARIGATSPLVVDALTWLGLINLVLAVFNALPGAPLDGGRVLHALVWRRDDDGRRATRVACRSGELVGTIVIVLGLAELAFARSGAAGLATVLVGWFLRAAARAERAGAENTPPLDATVGWLPRKVRPSASNALTRSTSSVPTRPDPQPGRSLRRPRRVAAATRSPKSAPSGRLCG